MAASSPRLVALTKILALEKEKGYTNAAVTGGLDRFLQRWDAELRPVLGRLPGYADLSPQEREAWARDVLVRIAEGPQAPRPASDGDNKQAPPQAARASTPRRQRAPRPMPTLSLDDEIGKLRSVNRQSAPRLSRLGLATVRDLLYHFPHRHNDFANLKKVGQLLPGADQTVVVTVWEATETVHRSRQKSTQAVLGDDTGNLRAIWFNQPYLARTLTSGTTVVLSGKVDLFMGQFVFKNPEYEVLNGQEELVHTGRLVPVYPSTDGLPQRTLRRIIKEALDASLSHLDEFLPPDLLHRAGLLGLKNAVSQMHYPDSEADWKAARRRLAFDELFLLQLAVLQRRRQWREEGQGIPLKADTALLDRFLASLPFTLTKAQLRSLSEILDDIGGEKPMSRLLQGDVGSGKTIVAATALLVAAFNGYQGALMAPTEILAEQHFLSLSRMLSASGDDGHVREVRIEGFDHPVVIGLLLGSMSRRAKDEMHDMVRQGSIDLVIGTQALIQSEVEIPRLALVVVDEQQRFGVMQRAALRDRANPDSGQRGQRPHLLAMSATPIPRSLALTLYGDLDISIIDEMPPGRQQVKTYVVGPENRHRAYDFIRTQVKEGRQAFIVFPLIEESENVEAKAATDEHERLSRQVFPDLRLGLLHGRRPLREKEQVMQDFKDGKLDILVSTAVVEVGIDVPNATVMVIESADRFGLAQLHQFRGRVGRGQHQSYCLLLADSPSEEAQQRLDAMKRTSDGFQLAEEDLRIRGPGDYLGTRQSGLPDLKVASIFDRELLDVARREAIRLLESDPRLEGGDHARLSARFQQYAAGFIGELS